MSSQAVSDAEREQLDTLVPPPWPAARRRLIGLALAMAVVAIIVASLSGLLGPQLAWIPEGGWEARGSRDTPVSALRHITIHNEGRLPVRVQDIDPPDLEGLEWGHVAGVPATVPPGARHEITVSFTVRSCDIDLAGFNALPLRASSGLAPTRVISLPAPHNDPPIAGPRMADGRQSTTPPWPDQPPSWILDTIGASCLTVPSGASAG